MNKVRLLGLGLIITGVLIGYFFERIDLHLFSGMLIGVGVGWIITGTFNASIRLNKNRIDNNKFGK